MKRPLIAALGALALPAVVLALAAGALLWGFDLDGGFLRAPLERALTAAFGVPARLEGPMRLHTGPAATISAGALVLADPSGPAGATLARGVAPRARIDVLALLRGAVLLEEVGGQRLELSLRRHAGGRANWAQLFPASDGSSHVSFAGIERLRIDAVVGSYRREGEPPVPFAVESLDGALPLDEPARAAGRARIAGHEFGFDLRTASLSGLAPAAGFPVQGTLRWTGAQATVDGKVLDGGTRFDGVVDARAADGAAALAALGVAADDPGPLTLRGRVAATPAQVSVQDLVASLGQSKAAGSVTLAWAEAAPAVSIDLAGERLDVTPFLGAAPRATGTRAVEDWVARLERLAAAAETSAKLAFDEVAGLPVSADKVRLDLRSGQRALAAKAQAVLAGTAVEATLDYDARKPKHTLAARVESGAASTGSLPGAARPSDLAVAAGSIRGELRGEGADAAALVASLQGSVDARQLDWTFGQRSSQPVKGRFDVVRVSLHGTRASSAEVSGRIEGAACGLRISGGAAGALLAGEPWPVQFSANCPNERINARGRITLAERHAVADLTFDVTGDRSGPVGRALGLPPAIPYPLAAQGTLRLDATAAKLRLATVRLGRTTGSGEIDYPLGAEGNRRLRLALTTLDLDQIGEASARGERPADPLERKLLSSDLRLPDLDYDLAADRVVYGDARLRDFKLAGSVRGLTMRPAPFRIDWNGTALQGRAGLDLSGARPRVTIDVTAQDADLRALLAALGVEGVRLRAGKLSVSVQAQGERLRELLASATLDASLAQGHIELHKPLLPGATGRGSLDATLRAAPGQPSKLAARGRTDERPFDLAVDGPPVEVLAGEKTALPLALRATFDDLRLEADGRFDRHGAAEARVRLAGHRLDQLGHLVGLPLPEVSPYEASATVALAPRRIDVSGLTASFGRSRIAGSLRIEQREGGRAAHSVTMRASVLHLEDIGAGQWLADREPAGRASPESAARTARLALERLVESLPRADVDASIDLDSLLGGGQPFASARLLATVNAGKLRARLLDLRAQDGNASGELSIDASASPPRFELRANARDVEYGPLLRAMSPEASLNGQMDVLVDLSAQGPPADLLQALRGNADFAAYPRDMNANALGLWGAGLLPAILRAVDRDSQAAVLCSVGGFAVGDGVARSDGFFVETTRVRIIGEIEIRLGSWEIAGRIDPRSNSPQLFEISPRMQIGGAVGNPSLSVAPESLVLAPLRFASPLALFSRDWVGRGGRRAGGKADCRDAFERVLEAHQSR